jgi:5-methylcytosine-specific restriction endonuclease McrA
MLYNISKTIGGFMTMAPKKTAINKERLDRIKADIQKERDLREKTYRERALKMFPWICARCGREFSGKKLRELTVHHKDHNHDYNPPDGSNWELLCIYCHENEHSRYQEQAQYGETSSSRDQQISGTYRPFADLEALLKNKK